MNEDLESLRAEHYRERHADGTHTCGHDGERWPCRVRLLFVYYDAATRGVLPSVVPAVVTLWSDVAP